MSLRRSSMLAGLVAAACLAVLVLRPAAQEPVFRTGTEAVPLYVTVTDADRRLVGDLVRDDFDVFDNGVRQDITVFSNEPLPVTVVVMLDTSLSMTLEFDLLKQAAEQFLIRLLPEDRAVVGAFNDKIQFTSEFTNDRDALVASLQDLGFGNPTRLFDAIDASIERLGGVEGRRVVLVFTDGEDTYSKLGSGSVLDRARVDEVMIYAVGLENEMVVDGRRIRTRPDRGLRKLAQETGGGHFELDRKSELGETFSRVAQELHSQYVIGFAPKTLDGKVHKLEVRVKKPGLTARSRRSYVAAKPAAATVTPKR